MIITIGRRIKGKRGKCLAVYDELQVFISCAEVCDKPIDKSCLLNNALPAAFSSFIIE